MSEFVSQLANDTAFVYKTNTSVKFHYRSVAAVFVNRGKPACGSCVWLPQAAVVLRMASKETSPSKGRTKPRKRGEKKDGATPEGFSSSPDKKSETANTSLTVQLPKRGTRDRRERSLSPASIDPTPPEGGKSPKECAMPQTEGARERSMSPASKDTSPSKRGKSSKVYVKKVEGTPVPPPREHSLSPTSKETSPSTGKSPTVYVKKVEGTPVPLPTSARERLSPASKDLPPEKGGKSPTVYVDEATPGGATPHKHMQEISPVQDDEDDSTTGGCFPCSPLKRLTPRKTRGKTGASPDAASPDKNTVNTSFSMDENGSVSTGCFIPSPLKFIRSPKKPKKKSGATRFGTSPDKSTPETSPVPGDSSDTARCLSPTSEGKKTGGATLGPNAGVKPVQEHEVFVWHDFPNAQKEGGATPDAASPDKEPTGTAEAPPDAASPDKKPTPDAASPDKKPTADAASPDKKPTPGAASPDKKPTADAASPDKKPTADAASPDKKPTGTAGATPDAARPDKKPTVTAGATPDAARPDKKPTGTSTVQDAESDTPQCFSPTSKERSACPHPAQTSRQPEFATPQPPHPRAHRQTSAVSERSPAFGIDLSTDAAAADTDVPLVVSLCVAVVDNWCEQNKSCATSAYCQQGETKEMQAIVEAFNSGNITITTLNGFTAHSVANILKKYLRELPNPVIPEDMYDRFIEFIKTGRTTTSGRIVTTLVDLVNDMPAVHGSTLRHLLAHFSKILRWQDESGVQEKFEKLLNVFSHILMRPPWDRISELGENTKHHNDVLHRLILEGVWGVIMPALPQPTAHRPPEAPDSDSSPERRLHDAPWYWAGISKDLARDVMMNQPERSFMVRDSTTEGDYTLLVKFQNSIKSIKIMRRDDHYGLVEPLQFPSVVTLINWYQCNSLATFNSILNTTLVVPVIRSVAPEHPSGTPAQEVEVLRIINKRYKKQHALYDYLYEWYSWVAADIELKSQARDTYEHLLNVLDAQIGGLHSTAGPRANQDNQRLVTARERVQDCKKNISDHIQCQQGKHRLINGELSITKQEVHQLHKQRELWIAWLRARNMTQELIDRLADLNDPVWFVNCERAEATAILQGKLDGTFLIRPSREENMHALSIMYKGEVTHCKILCVGDYYGFSEHSLSFTSLKDLVNYYHDRSLASHNEELDICLLYPVHLVHVQGPSGARQS